MDNSTQTKRPTLAETVSQAISEQEAARQDEAIAANLDAETSFDAKRKTFTSGLAKRISAKIHAS